MRDESVQPRQPGVLTLRALVPNAITAAALCVGLTGIRFAITGQFEQAVLAIVFAGMLDGIDGRIARLLKAQSRFGAELDSLADSISFGVAPALIVFLWSLQEVPNLGWFASLAFALCCVLRLARYNARIDRDETTYTALGFLTGIPAPVGAGLAFLPIFLWVATGSEVFRTPYAVAVWLAIIAFLMIASLPTLSWGKLRPHRSIRLGLIAVIGLAVAALMTQPWETLVAICVVYLLTLPIGWVAYWRAKQRQHG